MIIETFPQRSDEWHKARIGVITASKFENVINSRKADTYLLELITEILIGSPKICEPSKAMERGIFLEEEALKACSLLYEDPIETVGLVYLDEKRLIACSPDALVEDGGIEIKCPNTNTHIKWLLDGTLPKEHKAQVQGCMWVCDRQWWDFVSYDPRIDRDLFVVRVERDEQYISTLKDACHGMEELIHKTLQKLE